MLTNYVMVFVAVVTSTFAISTTVVTASCGVQAIPPSEPPSTDIVGGIPATPHSWPWAAQLKFQGNHYCGATLIHPKWVVTAAHCTQEMWVGYSKVHLGSHSRDQIDVGKEVQFEVSLVVNHEFYDSYSKKNDIAMLKLKDSANQTEYVNIACLADSTTLYKAGTDGVVVGWGDDRGTSVDDTVLNQVVVPVIDMATCNSTEMYDGYIQDGMFCAGYAEGGKDACQGDSGGPYQVAREDGAWELYGLVSWGDGCAEPNRPGIYTHIPSYVDWINDNLATL